MLESFEYFFILLFVFFVLAFYTFYNAKGFSYLSDASLSCNNCHIMNEVYNQYLSSPHSYKNDLKVRATCIDCHLPHSVFSKWIAKAQSGLEHAYAFTFKLDELPTHLSASPKSKKMIQENCMRCHEDFAKTAINPTTNQHVKKSLNCTSCHKDVGHKHGF
ncbi:cytochrome c nitrite reductase small subunit [Campylobacter hepaticus]|nr:cytochrome c nitrite reductase small subunit [Campylobacter hepaticus]